MRMSFHRLPLLLPLVGLSPFLWGCPGTLADPAEFVDAAGSQTESEAGAETGASTTCTAADVPVMIFQQTCGVSGCHSPPSPEQMLDLASPGVASRLINIPSLEDSSYDLVSATDPQNSFIILKLTEKMPPGGGVQMPYFQTPLSAEQVACVQAWIDSVIPADAGGGPASMEGGTAATDSGTVDSSQAAPDAGAADSSHAATDSGKGASDAGNTPTFTEIYTTIFATNGCTTHHAGATPSGGLDMSTQAKAYADLVGVAAVTPKGETPACSGDRVVAGNAATSLLYEKVSETKPPCGVQMPKGGPYLSTAEQNMIKDWINSGAANN